MIISYLLVMTMLFWSGEMQMFMMMLFLKFGLNRDFLEQLILRKDLQLIEIVPHFHFLTHFHVLCQYVVALCAMSRKLVVAVPLIDISTLCYQIFDYFKMSAMGCQVKSSPLLNSSSHI
jgi:hypothetical protein